jgi:hypothetical protein
MATDIVFDQGDAISLQAARVRVTGRVNLPRVDGGSPPADGEIGDLVMTVEEGHNPNLNLTFSTTRLWLCVPAAGGTAVGGRTWWREIQMGSAVMGG